MSAFRGLFLSLAGATASQKSWAEKRSEQAYRVAPRTEKSPFKHQHSLRLSPIFCLLRAHPMQWVATRPIEKSTDLRLSA